MASTVHIAARPVGGAPTPKEHPRLASLDVFRGILVLLLVAGGTAAPGPDHAPFLAWLAADVPHAAGHGFRLGGLVQPGFAFLAGIAIPLASAARRSAGGSLFRHAASRCVALIALGNLLARFAAAPPGQGIGFVDPLSRVGLGCFVCVLILQLRLRFQVAAGLLFLAGPLLMPAGSAAWRQALTTSAAADCTVLFGCWAGMLVLQPYPAAYKAKVFAAVAAAALAEGLALAPVIPMRGGVWTASFTFFSLGCAMLLFAVLFWLIECRSLLRGTGPFAAAGENAILAYCLSCLLYKLWNAGAPGAAGAMYPILIVGPLVWFVCCRLRRRGVRVKL